MLHFINHYTWKLHITITIIYHYFRMTLHCNSYYKGIDYIHHEIPWFVKLTVLNEVYNYDWINLHVDMKVKNSAWLGTGIMIDEESTLAWNCWTDVVVNAIYL